MPAGDTPVPDPTILTTEALARAVQAERDYVNGQVGIVVERLSGIDRATELLSETVNRVPTETQLAVGQLGAVVDERFKSVETQFRERDTRSEREARDNKLAVDAAFAAQEKQAVAQNDANTTAINKSEQATTETINKLAELFKTSIDALTDKVDDLKQRVQALESGRNGATEYRQESRAVQQQISASMIGWAGVGVLVLSVLVGVIVKFT